MGVPKFFRYISERYPCLSEVVKEYQIPEFDHLYLDMNGIIHTCSHPDDGDAHFRITEEKIFKDIFHYIEVLFRMIKPRKLFFMAVDGVAPRAKMNQQRGRRFRSAREAQTLEAKARERGETLPTEARFDSNCITPGTVFMARLHEQLKYFVVHKISTDKLWQNCKIILSGHETPGEGEHKIMDYIRYTRAQPGYDPNTRHCLYGLDADLIMLGLCTHEPHFSLLREEVKFGKKSNKRKNIPEQITFYLLHLSLMREYLELEFLQLKDILTFEYDIEKIIDDWVLMGFLVGNDFIPHLPNMHITNGALPILYNTYMKVLPKLGGYINESGRLNLQRFEIFIQELGSIDLENFSEKYADLKWFESKTGRRFNEKTKSTCQKLDIWEPEDDLALSEPLEPYKPNSDLAALIKATDDMLLEPSVSDHQTGTEEMEEVCDPEVDSDNSDDSLFNAEFIQHKTDYYRNKLEYENVTPEVLQSQAEEYVRAIQWNLHYYYNGVCSWSWYYPHHYAPYVSDIKGFSDFKFSFELGTPFQPYEQLLAVLPAASKSLLPQPYQDLMTNEDSPIKEYYPEDFKTDLNGKKQEWEAVVLIPFIEENVLLKAMGPCNEQLTPEEKQRNTHGPMLVYTYTLDNLGCYEAPEYFPSVTFSHAKCELVAIEDIRIPRDKLVKGAYPGVKFDVFYPGFPTMKHLNYVGSLEKARVKVFEQPSKGENMILRIIDDEEVDDDQEELDEKAKKLLGKTVHVGWPHLIEALVVSVSNREFRYHSTGEKGQYNVEENKGNLASLWHSEKQGITDHYQNRLGIDVGLTNVLVHVKVMVGRKYMFSQRGRITLEKQWNTVTSAYPLQTVVYDIAVYEDECVAYKDVTHVFSTGSFCFMLGQPGYGVMAEVLDSQDTLKEGRIKINLKRSDEPDLTPAIEMEKSIRVRYMAVYTASAKLGISKGLFSRITGSIYIAPGGRTHMPTEDVPKVNIGLNLKFNKKNEEVPGYSRKEGTGWQYSDKAVELVATYMKKFPSIFEYLNYNVGNDVFYEEEVFPYENAKEILREVTTWIKQQPFFSVERQVCGSSMLYPETIKTLEEVINEHNAKNSKPKQMLLKVKPHLLYKVSGAKIMGWFNFFVENTRAVSRWSHHRFGIMALTCWAVGLSNCWRFPVVISTEGGGGAFLIPCTLVTVFLAIPLTYMELALGQYSNKGPIAVWNMCLFWKGSGWASMFTLFSLTLYYGTICSYLLFYAMVSLQNTLPWSECNPKWAKENCFTFANNKSVREACANKHGEAFCQKLNWQNSAAHYWGERVLKRIFTGKFGSLRIELILCNIFTLTVVFFCLRRGTQSMQKVLGFFCVVPYLEQMLLLFVSLIHPGSVRGMQRFLQPDFTKLNDFRTWRLAVEQTMCSLGIGLGGLTTLGAHNSFRNPVHMDAIVINLIDLTSSLMFGVMTFNALGALSYSLTISMDQVLEWSDTMLFVRIPLALLYWPGMPQLWSLLFYSSVYLIGVRSQIFLIATLLSSVYDTWPVTQKYMFATVGIACTLLFVLSIPYYTQMGSILLNYMDNINAGCLLLCVIFLEVSGVIWLYGMSTYIDDMHFMLGFRASTFWKFSWAMAPLVSFLFFIASSWDWFLGNEGLPPWTWLYIFQVMMYTVPLLSVAFFATHYITRTKGMKCSKALKPSPVWGPTDAVLRKSRDMFSAHSMTKEYMYRQNRLRARRFQPEVPVVLPSRSREVSS
ncbi:hypothetical protein ILUMI_20983 [Ignelater luminosus]|uniref:5'-3' exoribonuclease 2 n=1 Tax=Ignelater luminosus TaxID=2038154 RepID=A0A8K0CGG8_IGNLU|nr:hypothetical protein ILUMI_20983 [Ignelater luminosus]